MFHTVFLRLRMFISVFLSLFLCIIEGTGIAWSSPMLKKLNGTDDNPLKRIISTDESSLLASLSILGSIFASFVLMIISGKIGRKPLLALHGMASLVCYVILAFSANIWCYYLARFISGFNSAVISIILPLYICELADSSSRGACPRE
ncbi:hypothetical protein WA026_005977 [Henosepilachna vigintioctopunctata]|uniref:Major facilitator superfamily (MFS) profile domain-containing protein n=1 Tax=Henosepilachna vigintioctopunctata TaxID=420089 RepID=A0AAW1TUF0_9CUCU